jgi:hypothetical protein
MKREFTIEQVEAWAEALVRQAAQDPPKRTLDTKATIALLKEKIAVARRRGYSLAQIAEILRAAGLPIVTSTLSKHLQAAKRAGPKGPAAPSPGQSVLQATATPTPVPTRVPQPDPVAAASAPPSPPPPETQMSRTLPLPGRFRF